MKGPPSSFHVFSSPSSPRQQLFFNNPEANSEYNQLKFSLDSSDKDYDSNTLFNLLRREKNQLCIQEILKQQGDSKQRQIKAIMMKAIQDFSQSDCENDGQDKPYPRQINMLQIKLQTLMFLEVALVMNENIDSSRIQLFFYCAYNMALKSQSVLVKNIDLEKWIRAQRSGNSIEFWNRHILGFEEFIFRNLNWNTDVVTAASILQFFLETHFQELQYSRDFSQKFIEEDIVTCFIKQKWSNSSIALGCLAYQLRQLQDTSKFEYLLFLLDHYASQVDIFDLSEIYTVFQYLQSEAAEILAQNQTGFDFDSLQMQASCEDLDSLSPIPNSSDKRFSQLSTQATKQSEMTSPFETQSINRKRKFSATSSAAVCKHSKQLFSSAQSNDPIENLLTSETKINHKLPSKISELLNKTAKQTSNNESQDIEADKLVIAEEIQKRIKRNEDQSVFQIAS